MPTVPVQVVVACRYRGRRMVHEWLRRYAPDGGLAYLVDRSSRPREFGDAPEDIDPGEILSLLPYMTAYQVLHRTAEAKSGDSVLMHGAAGRVGIAALELGALAGLRLYGTASARDRVKVEALGAVAIDYRNEDFLARVREEAGGVDIVVDSLGGPISLRSFRALRPGRRLVVFGRYSTLARAQGPASGDGVVRGDRCRVALGQAVAPPEGARLPRPEVPRPCY